jgi:hypothetical protein
MLVVLDLGNSNTPCNCTNVVSRHGKRWTVHLDRTPAANYSSTVLSLILTQMTILVYMWTALLLAPVLVEEVGDKQLPVLGEAGDPGPEVPHCLEGR